MAFLYEYGLFLAKAVTIVLAIGAIIVMIAGAAMRNRTQGAGVLTIESISESIKQTIDDAKRQLMSKEQRKAFDKEQKKAHKNEPEAPEEKLFVIEFNGDMQAKQVTGLREEISAVIKLADPHKDKVLIKLESGGGVVHGYGLAASQIARLRQHNIHVTVSVDKIAASGGYMMASVADRVIAAPFAIIGSIGVVAQLPNFHRLLKKNEIDIELHTAGNYKRTLTMLGKNTEEGRDKFKQELTEVHELFKSHISQYRPQVDIEKVATGEYWYGSQAKDLDLVDDIVTSDDELLGAIESKAVFQVQYKVKQSLADKVGISARAVIDAAYNRLFQSTSEHIH